MYQLTTVSFITTYQCTAACDHCCFNCNPSRRERIGKGTLLKYVSEASKIPTVKVIVFTGGECTLLGEDLFEAIDLARNHNIVTRCVTNGHWGSNKNRSVLMLRKLKESGLTEINFSTGSNHAKYVPVEHVKRAAMLSCESGYTTVVNIEEYEESEQKKIIAGTFNKLKEKYSELIVRFGVWIPNGGKSRVSHGEEHRLINHRNDFAGCDAVLSTISITPDEKLAACCGLYLNRMPEMIIGDLKENSLCSLVEKMNNDFMKIWLAVDGPERITDLVSELDKSIQLDSRYVHPCQACLILHKHKKWKKAIYDAANRHINRVYDRYLTVNSVSKILHGGSQKVDAC